MKLEWREKFLVTILLLFTLPSAHAGILHANRVLLLCHRTANRDLPENTLQSLAFAARMGCDIVEVDVRRTLDGQFVLNHDGFLDRFTDTTGQIEDTDLRELDEMDFGKWMGQRFSGMRIAHFDDALQLAHELHIGLYLDIKTKGIGREVLDALSRTGMTDQVIFGGEWDDIHKLDPSANSDRSAGLQPGFTSAEIDMLHGQHAIVIANFILNGHEFDLQGMKQAVAMGADGIMVDYPQLGAEAVGRPVEQKIDSLIHSADTGVTQQRILAIRQLTGFVGFPLRKVFFHWLLDRDQQVSHEAALALVFSKPLPNSAIFEPALHSPFPSARGNAAWAIGFLAGKGQVNSQCGSWLSPLLSDKDIGVVKQTLVALARCPRDTQHVSAAKLDGLLSSNTPILRGLAAVALAKHHPRIAEHIVPQQLESEEGISNSFSEDWTRRGRPALSETQIHAAVELYRAQMKELQAICMLPDKAALPALASQAFRPGYDYSMMPVLVSGFQLWDRLAEDPEPAIHALSSSDHGEADWAEWSLVQAGPRVLPKIRQLIPASTGRARQRLIEILGWQADEEALSLLTAMEASDAADVETIHWAIARVHAFSLQP